MGRPLNKKYFGNRNIGSASTTADDKIGGSAIGSIALGAANNSSGFSAGAANISIATPTLPTGVRATASLVVGPAGAFLTIGAATSGTDRTTFTATGTGAAVTGTYTGLVQKAGGTTTGTGAVFSITKATTGTNYATGGVLTVITATSKGTGYVVGDTIKIDGASIGGVTTTNDITLTVVGAVAAAGTITGITITEGGSGYTTVPAVTLSTGTQGTLTVTAAFAADTGAVGSATNQENTILMTAFLTGGSAGPVDIIRQVSTNRFKVTDGTRTGIVKLKSSVATAAGEASVRLVDTTGTGTYFATKITSRKATITRGTGSQAAFVTGTSVPWNMTAATATSLLIDNA
jgi:hypothetical protein